MLKIICSVLALVILLSIVCSNKVDSRIVQQNYEGIPASQLHHLRFGKSRLGRDNHIQGEQDGYEHVKRKSDFLLSLYGLPYTLVNKREFE